MLSARNQLPSKNWRSSTFQCCTLLKLSEWALELECSPSPTDVLTHPCLYLLRACRVRAEREKLEGQRKGMREEIFNAMSILTEHKCYIQERLSGLQEAVRQRAQEVDAWKFAASPAAMPKPQPSSSPFLAASQQSRGEQDEDMGGGDEDMFSQPVPPPTGEDYHPSADDDVEM